MENKRIEMENGRQKRGTDRNRELRTETGCGEKRRMNGEKRSTDGNGREGRGCGCGVSGVFGVCRECDRVVRNMMEGMEPSRMSRNGAGALEMDLAKFYVTVFPP